MRRAPVCHRRRVIAVGGARLVRLLRADASDNVRNAQRLRADASGDVGDAAGGSALRSAPRVAATMPGAVGAVCPVSSPFVRRALRSVRVVLCFPHAGAPRNVVGAVSPRLVRGRSAPSWVRHPAVPVPPRRELFRHRETPLRPGFGYPLLWAVPLPVPP